MSMTFDELDMSAFIPVENTEEEEIEKEEEEDTSLQDNKDENPETPAEDESPEGVGGEDEDDEGDDSDEDTSQPNLYSSLAKVLYEEGVLPSLSSDKKIKSVDDLVEAFREEIKANEYADLTEEQKAYLQALRTGLPAEEVVNEQSILQNLKSIQDEELSSNAELRKQIIYQDFILKGYTPEKAEKYTQRSIDIGEDEADAKDALQSIIQIQEQQLEQKLQIAEANKLKQQEESQKQLQTFKKYLEEAKEIVPGVKINQKIAEKVFEQAVKPIAKLPNGTSINAVQKARLENPIEFEAKLNYLFYITKGFSDFSKIAVSQKSKAVKELDDFVKGNTFAPKASSMGSDFDYTPKELKGGFDESIINNIT